MFSSPPPFDLLPIDLSQAGQSTYSGTVGVVVFVRAEDAVGGEVLGAKVNVQLGAVIGEPIPMTTNGVFRSRRTVSEVVFTWAAQPGVKAFIMVSANDDVIAQSPPSRQLVTQSISSALSASAATVGTSAALLAAVNATRQKLTVKNNSASAIVYLGADGAVSAASGFPLGPGEGFTFEGTTAAVYAIASAAADVRILAEG